METKYPEWVAAYGREPTDDEAWYIDCEKLMEEAGIVNYVDRVELIGDINDPRVDLILSNDSAKSK